MLSNARIGYKLAFGFTCVIAALLISAAVTAVTLQHLADASRRQVAASIVQDRLDRVTSQMNRVGRALLTYSVTGSTRFFEVTEPALQELATDLDVAGKAIPPDRIDLAKTFGVANKAALDWVNGFARPLLKAAQDAEGRTKVVAAFQADPDSVSNPLHAVMDANVALAAWSKDEARDQQASMRALMMVLVGGTAAALVLSVVAGGLVTRSITRPLGRMIAATRRLAAGDLSVEVPAIARRDEVGEVGRAVQLFKESGLEKRRVEAEVEAHRRQAEAERLAAEAVQRHAAEQSAAVVAQLGEGLARLAAGDLTYALPDAFPAEYQQLRDDFNAALIELRAVVGTIVSNTQAIRSGTGEITQAADDLSRRTEQQAASLEQTAAALDEITATVRRTADGAEQARSVAAAAKQDAELSGTIVANAVQAMGEIEGSARQISQIIGVIDEIAFQTNLLALNAGVEAARAGDAGRGFAVVASEVRALAQRSAQAAKEIKTLISSSGGHVEQGVRLVAETGHSLQRILGQVSRVNDVVVQIAASAQEQASGLAEVNIAINQMDQVTQQNAAMVEQSTAASHSLAQDAAGLEKLTERFQTGAEATPTAAPPAAAHPLACRAQRGPARHGRR